MHLQTRGSLFSSAFVEVSRHFGSYLKEKGGVVGCKGVAIRRIGFEFLSLSKIGCVTSDTSLDLSGSQSMK